MLFTQPILEGITAGTVTLAFRRWNRPSVRPGSKIRTGAGVIEIQSIDLIEPSGISAADARLAGFPSVADLLASLHEESETRLLYRIRLRYGGPDPRIELRERRDLTEAEFATLASRLSRLDRDAPAGPWCYRVLAAIRMHPGLRAANLADALAMEKMWLKTHVRKLKNLGLTESLETGYRLSPRGAAVLARLDRSG